MNSFLFHFLLSFSFYRFVLEIHDIERLHKGIKREYPKTTTILNVFLWNEINIITSIIMFCLFLENNRYILSLEYNNVFDFIHVITRVCFVYVMTEAYFYVTHRFLFHGQIPHFIPLSRYVNHYFKKIHKMHHKFFLPIPRSAFFAHPIENIISNAGTLFVPLYICPLPYSLTLAWAAIALTSGIRSHSGNNYEKEKPFIQNKHDYHHIYNNVEYGTGFLMDYLFRTTYPI